VKQHKSICSKFPAPGSAPKLVGVVGDIFVDLANLGHGLLGLKGWICRAGDVGTAHKLFHKAMEVGGSERVMPQDTANHMLPDHRAFSSEIHVVQPQHHSPRSRGCYVEG